MKKKNLVSADQIMAHMVGDYIIQSDYMAQEKTKNSIAAFWHALTYTASFVLLTKNPFKLFIIGGTHFLIDRFRLARYVCYAKNQLTPKRYRYKWSEGDKLGYKNDSPPFLGFWLLIIADNTMHILINALVLRGGKDNA